MECKTKTGILLLMIMQILTILSALVMYGVFFSINLETLTSQNLSNMLFMILPVAGIGGIGALLGLIGGILFLLGRKEFGEKHQKFIFYAIIIFVISIVVAVVIAGLTMVAAFSSITQSIGSQSDPSDAIDIFRNGYLLPLTFVNSVISAILGGLIWVFGLYNLENEKGRRVLYVYFICLVATTIVAGVFSYMAFNDYLLSEGFEELMNSSSGTSSSITQLASYIQWVGPSAIISLIGAMVSNALLLFALYIPYKRITSGELVPLSPTTAGSSASDRRCPNCGQSIPFDANICPYCSKRFDDYL